MPKRRHRRCISRLAAPLLALVPLASGCSSARTIEDQRPPRVGAVLERTGIEIMVAGELIHTGAPVVLWFDPGGYDAYRVTRRFARPDQSSWDAIKDALPSPNRYNDRPGKPEDGWNREQLAGVVDQFVIHYDVAGASRSCFRILHDMRGLSVHFLLDVDGTIYQTLDVTERAWHATKANSRSVGIEIAQIGAYPPGEPETLDTWHDTDAEGTFITFPGWLGDGGVRTPNFVARPARDQRIRGVIQGRELEQYDFTDEQYESLIRLTAALNAALPEIRLDYPRDATGDLLTQAMTGDDFDAFTGLIAHYHIQTNKIDPGPAFDWDRVVNGARSLRAQPAPSAPRPASRNRRR